MSDTRVPNTALTSSSNFNKPPNPYLLQLEKLLNDWQNQDASIRRPAEHLIEYQFSHANKNRDNFVLGLCQLLSCSQTESIRNLICILFRKRLPLMEEHSNIQKPLFCSLNNETKKCIRQNLLSQAINDSSENIRNQIIDCITELTTKLNTFEPWFNEVFPWTLKLFYSSSSTSTDIINSLQIMGYLSTVMNENSNQNENEDQMQSLLKCFRTALNHKNIKVKISSIEAISMAMKYFNTHQRLDLFSPLIPNLVQLLENIVQIESNSTDYHLTCAFIEIITSIASIEPLLFNECLNHYSLIMMQICMNENISFDVRTLALEFLLNLAQSNPNMCRKTNFIVQSILHICINSFLLYRNTDQQWLQITYDNKNVNSEQNENNPLPEIAEYAIDRLTDALSSQFVLPFVWQLINENEFAFWKNNDWKYRYCVLSVVSQISEYIEDDSLVEKLISQCLPYFNDDNIQVCYAAINVIGQMCTDHPDIISESFSKMIFLLCDKMLSEDKHPKIQTHSCACILNLVLICEQRHISQYLDSILLKLFNILKKCTSNANGIHFYSLQKQALTAIASLAFISEQTFIQYYDIFAQPLMYIIHTSDNDSDLKARALECMGHMGKAVGNAFHEHAIQLLSITIKYFTSMNDDMFDDNADEYYFRTCIQIWPKICNVMGKEFTQYFIPDIIGILNRIIKMDIKSTEIDHQCVHEHLAILYGTHKMYNTGKEETKIAALYVLQEICEELKSDVWTILPSILKQVIILLSDTSLDVKKTVIEICATFVECAQFAVEDMIANSNDLNQITLQVLQTLDSIFNENIIQHQKKECTLNTNLLSHTCKSMTEILKILDSDICDILSIECLSVIVEHILKCVQISHNNILFLSSVMNDDANEDIDEIDEIAIVEEEEYEDNLLFNFSLIVGEFIKIYKCQFLPVFENHLSIILQLMHINDDSNSNGNVSNGNGSGKKIKYYLHKTCIYFFCDIYENCTNDERIGKYISVCIPSIMKILSNVADNDVDVSSKMECNVSQAGFYCLGIMFKECADECSVFVEDILKICLTCIVRNSNSYVNNNRVYDDESSDGRQEFFGMVDNAMSTICKVIKYGNSGGLNPLLKRKSLEIWLAHLPVKYDSVEAHLCHGFLLELIQSKDENVFGNNLSNLPKILSVLASFVSTEMSTQELDQVFKSFALTCVQQQPQMGQHLNQNQRRILGLQ